MTEEPARHRAGDATDGSLPEPTMKQFPWAVLLIGVGGVAVVVGSFLPWVTFPFPDDSGASSFAGTDDFYGKVTVVVGVLIVLLALRFATGLVRRESEGGLLGGVVTLAVVGFVVAALFVFPEQTGVIESSSGIVTGDGAGDFLGLPPGEDAEAFSTQLEIAFDPGRGSGVWVTTAGALLAGAAASFVLWRRRPENPTA